MAIICCGHWALARAQESWNRSYTRLPVLLIRLLMFISSFILPSFFSLYHKFFIFILPQPFNCYGHWPGRIYKSRTPSFIRLPVLLLMFISSFILPSFVLLIFLFSCYLSLLFVLLLFCHSDIQHPSVQWWPHHANDAAAVRRGGPGGGLRRLALPGRGACPARRARLPHGWAPFSRISRRR